MDRMVNLDVALQAMNRLYDENIKDYGCEIPEGFNRDSRDRARFALKQLPRKEIVYCEECGHWDEDDCMCKRPELSGDRWHDPKFFETYPDDFCSYGKEKDE